LRDPYLDETKVTIIYFIEGVFKFTEEDRVSAAELPFYVRKNRGNIAEDGKRRIHTTLGIEELYFDYD